MDLEVKAKATLQELLDVVNASRQQSVKAEQEAGRLRMQCEAWRKKVLELEQRNARLRRMLALSGHDSTKGRLPSVQLNARHSSSAIACPFGSVLALAVALSSPATANTGAEGSPFTPTSFTDRYAVTTAAAAAGAAAIVAMWRAQQDAWQSHTGPAGQSAPDTAASMLRRGIGGRGSGGGTAGCEGSAVGGGGGVEDGPRAKSSSSLSSMATGGANSNRGPGRAGFKLVVRGGNGDSASLRQLSTYGAMFPSAATSGGGGGPGGSGGSPQVHESYSMGDLTLVGRSSEGQGRLFGRGSASLKPQLGLRTSSVSSAGQAERPSRSPSPAEGAGESGCLERALAEADVASSSAAAGTIPAPVASLARVAPDELRQAGQQPGAAKAEQQEQESAFRQQGHSGRQMEPRREQQVQLGPERRALQPSGSDVAGGKGGSELGRSHPQATQQPQEPARAEDDDLILTSVSEPGPIAADDDNAGALAGMTAQPADEAVSPSQRDSPAADPAAFLPGFTERSDSDSACLTSPEAQGGHSHHRHHHHHHHRSHGSSHDSLQQLQHAPQPHHHHHHHHHVRRRHTHLPQPHMHGNANGPQAFEPAGPGPGINAPHSAPHTASQPAATGPVALPPAGPVGRTQSVCVGRLHPMQAASAAVAVPRRESLPVHFIHAGSLGSGGIAGSAPHYSDDLSWHAGCLHKQLSKLQDDLNSIQQSSNLIRSNRATCNLAPGSPRHQSLTSSPGIGTVIRRETAGAVPHVPPPSPFESSAAPAIRAAGAGPGTAWGKLGISGGSESGPGDSDRVQVARLLPRTRSGPLEGSAPADEGAAASKPPPKGKEAQRKEAPATAAAELSAAVGAVPAVASAPAATPPTTHATAQAPGPPSEAASSPSALVPTRSSSPSCQTCQAVSPEPAFVALYWVTPPAAALVVAKPSPSVRPALLRVLQWLRNHGIATYVEPSMLKGELGLECRVGGKAKGAAGYASPAEDGGFGGGLAAVVESDGGEWSEDSDVAMPVCASDVPRLLSWPHTESEGDCLVPPEVAEAVDFVVVLGGDGTVLWTCHIFGNQSVPPVVPFNLGSLGFLTPFDQGSVEGVLEHVMEGGFPIMLRHRLHCHIVRAGSSCPAVCGRTASPACDLHTQHAEGGAAAGAQAGAAADAACEPSPPREWVVLNEVVIDRGISSFLTNLECYCDGSFVTHVQGDGLIVATPTGSTAYNLAAGGSMVHPQVPGILFTPICPHSLSFRPLIFPDHVSLCVQVPANSRAQMWCSFDGKDRQALNAGDAVIIRMSAWPVPTVCSKDASRDWFSGVREGLHWNMRRLQAGAGQ